ncbi:shikimate dehydrogenase [Micromonospora sp. 15K316]|uniref:shikimate dehydrogenase n=1 Tax=Micromonospora sp. 15K316 TaxID=2530376 RepID=UPI00104D0775|nr:shikimate dehydrogenase [Micromonospora sp. 15K316]TDC34520.1 shikimate dehydrogenase [Micromonospora sp. 15K316]
MTAHRAAVLGKPIAHSLSPVIHNAGYAAAGLAGWSYTRIECAASELPGLVAGLGPEWAGLSVTMPGKEAALAVADAASPVAVAIGAANTLVRRPDGAWYADNTDVTGMVEVLTGAGVRPGATVTVLGAGGTARAALAAAVRLDAREVTVVARREAAVDELRPVADALGAPMVGAAWADAATYLDADVVVSTVPKGVADPLAAAVPWRPRTVFFDAVYDPWPTPMATAAAAAGCRVVSGLELLLAQAVGQFAQFTGVPAPREAMAAALADARRRPGPSTAGEALLPPLSDG